MSEFPPGASPELPAVDERLVAPESRYEIIDGTVTYVAPADEPHGTSHARLAAIVEAHKGDDFSVAVDMLTRTSRIDDIAPDVSVYPSARHPQTGGRQLEQLAFEIASTESLGHAGDKAARLVQRGVRRVFVIDLDRGRVLEWSMATDAWSILDLSTSIEDPAFAVPLPIAALLDAAHVDDSIVRAFRARRHPEILAEREDGRREASVEIILALLAARGLEPTDDQRARIRGERDPDRLARWAIAAMAATDVATMISAP